MCRPLVVVVPMIERIILIPAGLINGTNSSFDMPVDYVPGKTVPFLNGQLVADQSFSESPPRTVTLQYPPLVGDSVSFYIEVA
jgi:hypothetical protein